MTALISISDIRRGQRPVLHSSTMRMQPASRIGIVGRNGAGKSSLLLALAGLLRHGQVTSWGTLGKPQSIAIVMQRPPLLEHVTAASIAAVHGVTADHMENAAPGVFDTALMATRTHELSGGQRQRLAVAIALARNDPLLLLDEPFANLDIPGRLALRSALANRHRSQPELTSIIAAHAPSDLHEACDSIVVLANHQLRHFTAHEIGAHSDLRVFEHRLAAALHEQQGAITTLNSRTSQLGA